MTKPDLPPLPRSGLPNNHHRASPSESRGFPPAGFDAPSSAVAAPWFPQPLPIAQQQLLLAAFVACDQDASRTIRFSAESGQSGLSPRPRGGSRSHLLSLLEEVLRIIDDDGEGLEESPELE